MKVLVTGGRDFSDRKLLFDTLDGTHINSGIDLLINGGAPGADALSSEWARGMEIQTMMFMADWIRYGKKAGPIRNQQMIDEKPDLVLAFPGGVGTADCVRRAEKAGIPVGRIEGAA